MTTMNIIIMLGMYIGLYSILVYLIFTQREQDNSIVNQQDICHYSGLPSTSSYQDMELRE